MNLIAIAQAAQKLGYKEPSVELDGIIWTGTDENRVYLTDAELKLVYDAVNKMQIDKATAKQAVLDRLGITADEAALLLG
jgi:hypothetical protein